MDLEGYTRYRWFFTKSGKLVVGGKSAEQNDELINRLKEQFDNLIIMHTKLPGSPFTAIIFDPKKLSQSDLEQTAIFTGCFSKAWSSKSKKAVIDIFHLNNMSKPKGTKTGTWIVSKKIKSQTVNLSLVLTKQKNKLRAVPRETVKDSEILLEIIPGNIKKESLLPKLALEINGDFSKESILSALPAGGIKIKR